jgi:enoyl-CoA hydratase
LTTIIQTHENNIAYLTIKSPPANALSSQVIHDLNEQLNTIETEDKVKAIIVHGEGKFFSAGADIKEFTSLQADSTHEDLAKNGQNVFQRIEDFSIPVIAAVHGAALGGGLELAMACHIRIVGEDTKLGLPELNLGIIPGFAGTQRLPRYVGAAKAYEMILTGEPIRGIEAEKLGLANQVVADEAVLEEATNLAEKIAAKSKPTIHEVMRLIKYSRPEKFLDGVASEAKSFSKVFDTKDAEEGINAFVEKRKPNFIDQ